MAQASRCHTFETPRRTGEVTGSHVRAPGIPELPYLNGPVCCHLFDTIGKSGAGTHYIHARQGFPQSTGPKWERFTTILRTRPFHDPLPVAYRGTHFRVLSCR